MREFLLHLIVACLGVGGLISPLIGLYGYLWFSLMRPDALAWVSGRYPYSQILAFCVLFGVIRKIDRLGNLANPIVFQVFVLIGIFTVSVVTAVNVNASLPRYFLFLRIIAVALVIPLYISTIDEFRVLMYVMGFSIGFIGLKFGAFFSMGGGQAFESGFEGFISDNNTLALALVMAIPMCWYSRAYIKNTLLRWAATIMVFGNVTCVVISHSRGGSLALFAVFLLMIARSRKKAMVLVGVVCMLAPPMFLAWKSYSARMATLENPVDESSAASRIRYWKGALRLAQDYPITGVGFGTLNQIALSKNYLGEEDVHVVHNNYLQLLTDSGVPALAIYLTILFGSIVYTHRSANRMKTLRPDLMPFPLMLEASLVGFAVGSMFLSRTDYDYIYFIFMSVAVWRRLEKDVINQAMAAQLQPAPVMAMPAFRQPLPPLPHIR